MEHLLTVTETAKRLGVSKPTLYRMIRQGRFPALKIISEKRRGVLESELNEWMQKLSSGNESVGGQDA